MRVAFVHFGLLYKIVTWYYVIPECFQETHGVTEAVSVTRNGQVYLFVIVDLICIRLVKQENKSLCYFTLSPPAFSERCHFYLIVSLLETLWSTFYNIHLFALRRLRSAESKLQ